MAMMSLEVMSDYNHLKEKGTWVFPLELEVLHKKVNLIESDKLSLLKDFAFISTEEFKESEELQFTAIDIVDNIVKSIITFRKEREKTPEYKYLIEA